MKYFVKFFVVTFLLLVSTYSFAEQKIAFIDMTYVLNKSKAGKGAQDYLNKTFKDNQKKFSNQESDLKKQEIDLLAKKSEMTQDEYKAKADELRKKVVDYQTKRRDSIEKIATQRAEARKKLLEKLDPILNKYSDENGFTLILDKKNVIKGNTQLDITEPIIEVLNKELPSLNLK